MRPTFSADLRKTPDARIRGTGCRPPVFRTPVGAETASARHIHHGKGS